MAEWPLIGHEWATDLLKRAIVGKRLGHAYLFSGPARVGKQTLAFAFARALLCERRMGVPCDTGPGAPPPCHICQRLLDGRYPDVQIIQAEKNTISIDQIRVLQADAALSPLEGQRKIFIILEIERATAPAANALLKTLEEPPPQVILLLTCVRRDLVLPTILSRCQVVGLRPLPEPQVEAALKEHWRVEPERAALLARLSGGRLGWAVTMYASPGAWEMRAKLLDDLVALTQQGYVARLTYSEGLSRQPENLENALGLWGAWWRDVMLIQRGAGQTIVNLDRVSQLEKQAQSVPPEQVERALTDLVHTLHRLRANVNARLALDVLTMRLPRAAAA